MEKKCKNCIQWDKHEELGETGKGLSHGKAFYGSCDHSFFVIADMVTTFKEPPDGAVFFHGDFGCIFFEEK